MFFSIVLSTGDKLLNMMLILSLSHLLLSIKGLNRHIHGTTKKTGQFKF